MRVATWSVVILYAGNIITDPRKSTSGLAKWAVFKFRLSNLTCCCRSQHLRRRPPGQTINSHSERVTVVIVMEVLLLDVGTEKWRRLLDSRLCTLHPTGVQSGREFSFCVLLNSFFAFLGANVFPCVVCRHSYVCFSFSFMCTIWSILWTIRLSKCGFVVRTQRLFDLLI